MGALIGLKLYARDKFHARTAIRRAFDRIAALDRILSDYQPDSELNCICRAAARNPVAVSSDLFRLLALSQDLARQTDAAFDITSGPVTHLWREARRTHRLPDPDRLQRAAAVTGYQKMHLNHRNNSVKLATPGMQLDVGGIAKGYAADEALTVLRQEGIQSALVAMSGNLVCSDPPPGQTGWRVAVPDTSVLLINNSAAATSGDSEQHLQIGDVRYSHIIDPRTGLALTHRITVTVVAPTGVYADGLSTAVSVLGPAEGLPLVERAPGCAALLTRP